MQTPRRLKLPAANLWIQARPGFPPVDSWTSAGLSGLSPLQGDPGVLVPLAFCLDRAYDEL